MMALHCIRRAWFRLFFGGRHRSRIRMCVGLNDSSLKNINSSLLHIRYMSPEVRLSAEPYSIVKSSNRLENYQRWILRIKTCHYASLPSTAAGTGALPRF